MRVIYCELPLLRIKDTRCIASNEDNFLLSAQTLTKTVAANTNVRLMRRPKESDNTRFVLSGKISDVCAALEQLAAQETRNACRCAF